MTSKGAIVILKPEEKSRFIEAYVKQLMQEIPEIAPYLSLRLTAELGGRKLTPEQKGRAEELAMHMMALKDDVGDVADRIAARLRAELAGRAVIATREQEVSCDLLSSAITHTIVEVGGVKHIRFTNGEAIRAFYERMKNENDAGVANAGMLFTRCLVDRFDETVLACFLAMVALTHYRESGKASRRQPLLETDVGLAGALVNMLLGKIELQGKAVRDFKNPDLDLNSAEAIETRCRRMVRVMCLMESAVATLSRSEEGMEHVHATELIRGILFAPRFDHVRASRFWELAAEAQDFPVRIFSEPSRDNPNPNMTILPMFTPSLVRSFGSFLDAVPENAAARFARAMTGADRKWRVASNEATGMRIEEILPVDDDERMTTFTRICGFIRPENVARRTLAQRAMLLI